MTPADLSSLPAALLLQELRRRDEGEYEKPECGSGPQGSYNTGLHVFALFLILILSTLACGFPIVARRFPGLPVPHRFLFLSRHFGTGVLIATAFVHLLPTAFVSLTDPCLPAFWNEGYPAMAGLVAMLSVFVVVGVEMFFATKGAAHAHGDYAVLSEEERGRATTAATHTRTDSDNEPLVFKGSAGNKMSGQVGKAGGIRHFRQDSMGSNYEDSPRLPSGIEGGDTFGQEEAANWNRSEHTLLHQNDRHSDSDNDIDLDDFSEVADPLGSAPNGSTPARKQAASNSPPTTATAPRGNTNPTLDEREEQRMLLQCLLLEAGILFHSIFIGMALSVATGTPFVVLLIAISFHQTFEGLALGSRIAAIKSFHAGASLKPWLMALAYGTTTPVGQAIGLGVHNLYDPASQAGLLTVGIMNAISSGLLLFAGLVELLAEDFLSEKSYDSLKGRQRVHACVSVVCGGLLMAAVGAFA